MNEPRQVTKPSGWKGAKDDAYWTKDSAYGCKYMCSKCGRQVLGSGSVDRMHWKECAVYIAWRAKEDEKKRAAEVEATAWLSQHRAGIIAALDACGDLYKLREAARRLGYEETP